MDNLKSITNEKSLTTKMMLYGSTTSESSGKDKTNPRAFIPIYEAFIAKTYQLSDDISKHLVYYYGTKSIYVAELGKQLNLMEKIVSTEPYIKAEIIFAIRHEMAVSLKDVLFRRLGIGFLNMELTKGKFVEEAAKVMQKECNWSNIEMKKQIKDVRDSIASLN